MAPAKVILDALGYKIKDAGRGSPPWRIGLEAKIQEAWKGVSWLTEVHKVVMRDRPWLINRCP